MLIVTDAADSHAIITKEQAKTELSITGTAQDALLEDLVKDASAIIAGYCGRDTFALETVEQTERLQRASAGLILARELNCTITSVEVDGVALTDDEWERDGAILYRLDASDRRILWPCGAKIVITYSAGYTVGTDVPDIIRRAALDALTVLYNGRGRDVTVRSEQTEGVGETQYFDGRRADVPPISADRLAALDRFRRLSVG